MIGLVGMEDHRLLDRFVDLDVLLLSSCGECYGDSE